MKKTTIICFLSFIFISLSSGEINRYNRKIEFGVEAEGGFSNNYIKATDILVKDLVIDIAKLADDLYGKDFVVDFNVGAKTWLALNFSEKFRLNFFWGVDASGYSSISQNFFDLLCKGFEVNSSETIDVKLFGDVYALSGFTFKTKIKDYGLHFTPVLFTPLFHVNETKATARYTSNEEGLIRAEADLPLSIYSIVDLDGIEDNVKDSAFVQDMVAEIIKNTGFDFTGEIERPFSSSFDLGLFTRIPIVPGRLKYKAYKRYWGVFEQKNALGLLNETNSYTKEYGDDDAVYSRVTKTVHRPFVLGLEGAWRPFGKWCTILPKVNLAVRNPYSDEAEVYGEYNLSADFRLLNIVGLKFATAYENLIFKHSMGFMINAHVLEIDAGVQTRGADFARSFGVTGFAAYVGLKAGF